MKLYDLFLASLICGVPVLVFWGLQVFVNAVDSGTIRDYVRSVGGRLVSKKWKPFGPGWFLERNDRIYAIEYEDHEGYTREAYAKVSLGNVFLMESRSEIAKAEVAERSSRDVTIKELEEENKKLREELEHLKRESP